MMEVIFYILMGTPVWMFAAMTLGKADKENRVIGTVIASILVYMICVPLVAFNYNDAARYQAIINKQEPIVHHYREYAERLSKKIEKAGSQGQAMFTSNHDTPVQTMVKAQLEAENNMLKAAKAIDEAKVKIEAIRLGVFGFVVKWIQEKGK